MTSHFDSTRQPGRPEGKPKIDTDIPLYHKSRRVSKYQWITELEVGHSFVIEESKRYQPEPNSQVKRHESCKLAA